MTDRLEVRTLWVATTAEEADEILTVGFYDGWRERVRGAGVPGVKVLGILLSGDPHTAARQRPEGDRMLLVALVLAAPEWGRYRVGASDYTIPVAVINRWGAVRYVPAGLWPADPPPPDDARAVQRAERRRTLLDGAGAEALWRRSR